MMFCSYFEELLSGCLLCLWGWSRWKVTRTGAFLPLSSQALWPLTSDNKGLVTCQTHQGYVLIWLLYPVILFPYFCLIGNRVFLDEFQCRALVAATTPFPWLLGPHLYLASWLHLMSTLCHRGTSRKGRFGASSLPCGAGWGKRHPDIMFPNKLTQDAFQQIT